MEKNYERAWLAKPEELLPSSKRDPFTRSEIRSFDKYPGQIAFIDASKIKIDIYFSSDNQQKQIDAGLHRNRFGDRQQVPYARDINLKTISEIFKNFKKGVVNSDGYLSGTVIKYEDEWFLVRMNYSFQLIYPVFFKCDQVEGVSELLDSLFLPAF